MVLLQLEEALDPNLFFCFSWFLIMLFFSKKIKMPFFFPDIPLRQVIAEECVAFLLNWRENEYLTMQVPLPLVQTNPYVKVMSTQSQSHVRL